jgi:hypothetical protein
MDGWPRLRLHCLSRRNTGAASFGEFHLRRHGCKGMVGRIAQLVEQRTEKSLLTHFTPFLPIAWTLTKPLILLAKTVFCPFSQRPRKIIRTDMKLAQ